MNKSTVKQKRSLGKNSPLSKRPKLDFTLTNRSSSKESSDTGKDTTNACKKSAKEKLSGSSSEKDQNHATSDWDDDFSGDMLEKVCLIADLSQAMVNNEPVPEVEKEKLEFFNKKQSPKTTSSLIATECLLPFEKLKLEFDRLQEKLKTKEGEVHILRSQLKQNEDAKQAAALQNVKVIEEIQEKYNDKLSTTEKELESTRSKLLFKDLEYKTLSERCRQLEYNISKSKFGEGQNASKPVNRLSQVTHLPLHTKDISTENCLNANDRGDKEDCIKFDCTIPVHHEGKNLARILCPEFFKYAQEPSVVPFYSYCSEVENHKNKVDKTEKYKWSDLPKQSAHIQDLYKDVSSLFSCENFSQKEPQKTLRAIYTACQAILDHENDLLKFLDELQKHNIEYEKADRCLLETEEKIEIVTIKKLLNQEKLNEEECGLESRRCLALIYSLLHVSRSAFDIVKCNLKLMKALRDIASAIGKLRRPLRYTGVLTGMCFIFQKLLEEKFLRNESLTVIVKTIEEIIFARPKLDVLREVINVLAASKHHVSLLAALCRRESVDSCMLYMDCKLKQAMFFTKNACPLKILCMQVMGLACLPCNRNILWDVTDCVIKWLNNCLGAQNSKELKWLPIHSGFLEEERCFNVTECLLYLLVLCLNDYNLKFPLQRCFDHKKNVEAEKKKTCWISIIGRGAVLFKRFLKADQRLLHEGSYSLRFATLLKGLSVNKFNQQKLSHANLSSVETDAISWINDLLGSDLRMQDCCLKQNTCALPDADVRTALKINADPRVI